MEELRGWITTIGIIISIWVGILAISASIKKYATEALQKHIETNCAEHAKVLKTDKVKHEEDLSAIKDTNRMMLKCHDVQLQALDKISRGESPNGEIKSTREDLHDFLRSKATL